jgi:hypothetical protein
MKSWELLAEKADTSKPSEYRPKLYNNNKKIHERALTLFPE